MDIPPIVGSLFSWKSLFTNRRTRDDCVLSALGSISVPRGLNVTFPTAASPNNTSLTLLLGFGTAAVESAIVQGVRHLSEEANGCLLPCWLGVRCVRLIARVSRSKVGLYGTTRGIRFDVAGCSIVEVSSIRRSAGGFRLR